MENPSTETIPFGLLYGYPVELTIPKDLSPADREWWIAAVRRWMKNPLGELEHHPEQMAAAVTLTERTPTLKTFGVDIKQSPGPKVSLV